jgi:hypothetical protein
MFTYYRAYLTDNLTESSSPKIEVLYLKNIPSDIKEWFTDKEKAIDSFNKAKSIALDRAKVIKETLAKLEKELEFHLDYEMLGDTYGIYESYLYINFTENGYNFTIEI